MLALLFGAIVGFSLGLTGGGGSIFAVPLLVYGLGVAPHEAVGVSLAAVGATAFAGFLQRLPARQLEPTTGLVFAAAGVCGAPLGSLIGGRLPPTLLLLAFSLLMVLVATRMWRRATRHPSEASAVRARTEGGPGGVAPACRRDPAGKLRLSSRCALLLAVTGFGAGVLSGLFGVGGGFVIVPALVFVSAMSIHHAVGTSLLVISLVSVSGVASHVVAGRPLAPGLTAIFVAGGVLGIGLGTLLAGRLSGPRLQRLFAAAILAMAAFVVVRSTLG